MKEDSRPIEGPREDLEPDRHVLRLTTGQLRQLIERLGGSAENEGTRVDCLLALLTGSDPT